MRFKISHQLHYQYSSPAYLEPQTLYIKPVENSCQRLHAFELRIEPKPSMSFWMADALGNSGLRLCFKGKHSEFKVLAKSDVETFRLNAFQYLPDMDYTEALSGYKPETRHLLQPYLPGVSSRISVDVKKYAERVMMKSGKVLTSFLPELCYSIYTDFDVLHREESDVWSPGKTLEKKAGACRDLAMFFIACCESQNLVGRFVSGYFEGDSETDKKDLHGWAEIFIEGAGWRAFDPSSGLAMNESFVALASGLTPPSVAPVIGTIRGNAVKSQLDSEIRMCVVS